jgi:hypothetical protein
MAATFQVLQSYVVGDRRETITNVTLDNSYPTGGYTITPQNLGLTSRIDALHPLTSTSGRTFAHDRTNRKLMAHSGGSQVTAATDLSAEVVRVRAIGV